MQLSKISHILEGEFIYHHTKHSSLFTPSLLQLTGPSQVTCTPELGWSALPSCVATNTFGLLAYSYYFPLTTLLRICCLTINKR